MNAKRAAREAQRLSIAIGVHFGPVVVGNLGSEERLEFTVVGDVVNAADTNLRGHARADPFL